MLLFSAYGCWLAAVYILSFWTGTHPLFVWSWDEFLIWIPNWTIWSVAKATRLNTSILIFFFFFHKREKRIDWYIAANSGKGSKVVLAPWTWWLQKLHQQCLFVNLLFCFPLSVVVLCVLSLSLFLYSDGSTVSEEFEKLMFDSTLTPHGFTICIMYTWVSIIYLFFFPEVHAYIVCIVIVAQQFSCKYFLYKVLENWILWLCPYLTEVRYVTHFHYLKKNIFFKLGEHCSPFPVIEMKSIIVSSVQKKPKKKRKQHMPSPPHQVAGAI